MSGLTAPSSAAGPSGLAVADNSRIACPGMTLPDRLHKTAHGLLNMVKGLAGDGPGAEKNHIHRKSLVQGHSDLRSLFGYPRFRGRGRPGDR